MHRPTWFAEDKVMVSTAPTCGLTKGGRLLPVVDPETGKRVKVLDPDTGEQVDKVNDSLLEDMQALSDGKTTSTLRFMDAEDVSLRTAVPIYYDRRYHEAFQAAMELPAYAGFTSATIGELVERKWLTIRGGHGSPSADVRVGTVPYIKVSDLRAGLVNINPTNRLPVSVAEKYWKGSSSGLKAWDLMSPERTSKNIGDFCVLLPGQEQLVVTKEVLVFRPTDVALFDAFYVLWAMSLTIVRDQWRRVVFMQTNREDVGKRYLEIEVPVPPTPERAAEVSEPFRTYYTKLGEARSDLGRYLFDHPDHHFFIGDATELKPDPDELDADADLSVIADAEAAPEGNA